MSASTHLFQTPKVEGPFENTVFRAKLSIIKTLLYPYNDSFLHLPLHFSSHSTTSTVDCTYPIWSYCSRHPISSSYKASIPLEFQHSFIPLPTPLTFISMLQSKQVSQVLAQVVAGDNASTKGPISVSLLSAKGLPLTTVTSTHVADTTLTADNLRVYSLLAINSFHQQAKCGDDDVDNWALLDLDGSLRAMVRKFSTLENNSENYHNDMFVVLFYSGDYSDALAKVRLDLLTVALAEGLRGYMSH